MKKMDESSESTSFYRRVLKEDKLEQKREAEVCKGNRDRPVIM